MPDYSQKLRFILIVLAFSDSFSGLGCKAHQFLAGGVFFLAFLFQRTFNEVFFVNVSWTRNLENVKKSLETFKECSSTALKSKSILTNKC